MHESMLELEGRALRTVTFQTIVLGSGAAGYCTADRLHALGHTDVAIVTEGREMGTSRNTGSDKQTYYKLSLAGDTPDSVAEMAQDLFAGGLVDGEHALCEAALSVQSFFRLVELGVPFPTTRYGEYVGYKTDHDPRTRATSVGPYTSKRMTEALERSALARGVPVYEGMQAVRVLARDGKVYGLLCLDLSAIEDSARRFVLFRCANLVLATGGPAGMYAHSVYPVSQHGATGMALEAGAIGKNLTEWQYGLASVAPRWNVSGTYMQALPRFVSTAQDGSDAREFLLNAFVDRGEMLSMVFLKGYQWPFDVRKAQDGSSRIDLLVHREGEKGRRVFLDFRENPGGVTVDFASLPDEARAYLERSGACFGTPYERLMHMNAPAVDFYRDRGVDLATEQLEIALCAQHNNGGLSVDVWWQTNVEGLFAVGECAGTHGVYRPGGSALNAGQVGALRAAQYIAARRGDVPICDMDPSVSQQISEMMILAEASEGETLAASVLEEAQLQMSLHGGPIRDAEQIRERITAVEAQLNTFSTQVSSDDLPTLFRLRDVLLSQLAYLRAMEDYIQRGGGSRGSALYTRTGEKDLLDIQEVHMQGTDCTIGWRKPRPVPQEDTFFENAWRLFREGGETFYTQA